MKELTRIATNLLATITPDKKIQAEQEIILTLCEPVYEVVDGEDVKVLKYETVRFCADRVILMKVAAVLTELAEGMNGDLGVAIANTLKDGKKEAEKKEGE